MLLFQQAHWDSHTVCARSTSDVDLDMHYANAHLHHKNQKAASNFSLDLTMVAQQVHLKRFISEGVVDKWGKVNEVRQRQATLLMGRLLDDQSINDHALGLAVKELLRSGEKPERVLHRHTTRVNFEGSMSQYNHFAGTVPHAPPLSYQIRELPVHRACRQGFPLEIIRLLIESFPESVKIPDSMHCLPLHCACGVYGDGRQHSMEVVLYLMDLFPKALEISDRKDCLPLHHAVQSAAPLEIVRTLVEHFPDAVHVSRQKKQTECYCSLSSLKRHLPLDHANKRAHYKEVQEFLQIHTFPPFPELDAMFEKLRSNPVAFITWPDT